MLKMARVAAIAAIAFSASVWADTARLAAAEAFVDRMYAPYLASPDLPPRVKLDDPKLASAALLALLRHSRAGIEGAGSTGGDLVCNCQSGPVRSVGVHGQLDDGDHATVRANFQAQGQDRTQTFSLVRGAGGWRVDDVFTQGRARSLREALAHDNADSDRALAPRDGRTSFLLQNANGRWSSGDCRSRFYLYAVKGDRLRIEDQSGQADVERISELRPDGFTGTTVASMSGEPVGSRWRYAFSGDQVRIIGPSPSEPIVQARCKLG